MKLWKVLLTAPILLSGAVKMHSIAQILQPPMDGHAPEELAATFQIQTQSFDFARREEMIPMRDGAKLYTVILIPRAEGRMPILLTRTPYGASRRSTREQSPRLEAVLPRGDDVISTAGYIRVFQDVRGKYGSEGEYRMNRPLRGPLNPSDVDHSTDTYDTIEWLLKNVPENNGRVGMIGTSYDGFLVLMGLVNPHPALKAAVPINPMVDTWMGDDWFHNGAFRQIMMDYIYDQEASRDSSVNWWNGTYDQFDLYMNAVSAGELGRRMGMEQLEFWRQLLQHPAYDAFWQGQALDKILGSQPLKVPTLYVHSLWDQEDIYGAMAAYRATESKDLRNDMNYLVLGPWSHSGSNDNGNSLGPIRFNGDTAYFFRSTVLLPFLNEHLKEGAPKADTPPVLAYQTGRNAWQRYDAWPRSCESGCPAGMRSMYLRPGFRLDFSKPESATIAFDEYMSDPAKPVPYRPRPARPTYAQDSTWAQWLVDDQRSVAARPDVLSYASSVLTQPVAISGQPIANLFVSTSGTDSDFVVKLIDVYPDLYPSQPALGGYQLMIAADILRGRYRRNFSRPLPVKPGEVEQYRWNLPTASHVFLPGHRIMMQVQSSWFPLYDRNPQTYVDNIFFAKPSDFRKATQRVYRTDTQASAIELPIVP
ncbi:MAG TPA: CocE/NonD family hydrolase [Acidobacteriota bacterium]|nr:CocE/NonD family hydrolase [Acidobacteriota bacterium]